MLPVLTKHKSQVLAGIFVLCSLGCEKQVILPSEPNLKDLNVAIPTTNKELGYFTKLHGFNLPTGVSQCKNWAEPGEYGLSAVLIEAKQLPELLSRINIKERHKPLNDKLADPNIHGSAIWSKSARSAIPGGLGEDDQIFLDQKAKPIEMFTCESRIGLYLHIDIWKVNEDLLLLRVFTFSG